MLPDAWWAATRLLDRGYTTLAAVSVTSPQRYVYSPNVTTNILTVVQAPPESILVSVTIRSPI